MWMFLLKIWQMISSVKFAKNPEMVKTGHLHIQALMKMTKQEPFILVTEQPAKMKSFLTTFALSVEDQLKKS